MSIVSYFFLTLLSVGIASLIGAMVTISVTLWTSAKDQQRRDLARYGHASSRWRIAMEILGIREIR